MRKTLLALALTSAFVTGAVAAAIPSNITSGAGGTSIYVAKNGQPEPGDCRGRVKDCAAVAKNGADDPAGDVRGGEGPGHRSTVAKNGADDPAGDDRGRHGPGHRSTVA